MRHLNRKRLPPYIKEQYLTRNSTNDEHEPRGFAALVLAG
jgi:hypothetical protein